MTAAPDYGFRLETETAPEVVALAERPPSEDEGQWRRKVCYSADAGRPILTVTEEGEITVHDPSPEAGAVLYKLMHETLQRQFEAEERVRNLVAEREGLEAALVPLAALEIPKRTVGNAGAYSILHDHIRAARAALSGRGKA